ncbi:MAG TPA: DapH/DapD/GlmU-related protein [Solirubrobacteraceae bacterium]|jgi:acetyltransferase-like isoleucine patch superfamily enzyme|nr:DapH/DapD/GlmU-related protein [Solirubrobacteraceae bacterium]
MATQRLTPRYDRGLIARLERGFAVLRWRMWQVRYRELRGQPTLRLGRGSHIIVADGGRIELGRDVTARPDLTISTRGVVKLGDRVFLGRGANIACYQEISIGADTRIAERVSIHDSDHVMEPLSDLAGRRNDALVQPVRIGERVWLAANVVVLRGVTVGDDVVVGANSVVTSDLPAGVVAAGAPAQVIRPLAP